MTSLALTPYNLTYYPTSNFPIPPPPGTLPPDQLFGMAGPFPADRSQLPYNGHMILGAAGFMTGTTLLIVCTRLYVRQVMLKAFGPDDWVISLGLLHTLGVMICFIGMVSNGGGRHWYHVQVPEEYERLKHFQYTQACFAIIGVCVVKVSIGLGMMRFIFGKKTRWLCKFLIAFVVVATIVSFTPFLVECNPQSMSWAYRKDPTKCIRFSLFKAFADVNGAINIATDFAFVLLPIPTIWKLQVNMRTKISLVAVLSVGVLAGSCAIARWYVGLMPFNVSDSPWTHTYSLWSAAELNAGLIAASLPPLRTLMSNWLGEQTRRFRTGDGTGNRYGLKNGSDPKSGWRRQHDVHLSCVEEWQKASVGSRKGDGLGTTTHAARGSLGDASSEEAILSSKPQGIMRSTEIKMQEDRLD